MFFHILHCRIYQSTGFEVLTAVTIKGTIVLFVIPCSPVKVRLVSDLM
jgi:hypothetical protein